MSDKRKSVSSALAPAALWASAFASSADAIVLTNPARRILSLNPAAELLFGYSAVEIGGRPVRDLYGPEEDFIRTRDALLSSNVARTALPVTMRHASASLFDASVAIVAIRHDKEIIGFSETIRADTNGRASTSEPLEAEMLSRSLRLARGVAHDFNNLLAIITGNVQLADAKISDRAVKRYLKEAEQACAMGARLTQRLMTFAKDRRLAPTRIDVSTLFAEQQTLWLRALGQDIALAVECADNLNHVQADRSEFENAILNLVINAKDAMPNGGRLVIAASAVNSVADTPNLSPGGKLSQGNYVRIAVSDTGIGMTSRVCARAFDPFFTTKAPGRGTGLGLASVLGFADQSNGTVTILSTPGQGTTVSLYLPVMSQSGT